jgi:HD-like signal output (HDOD) protein
LYITGEALQFVAAERLTREEKLEVCVDRIFHGEGVPPFCDHANEVMLRTLDPDGNSIELVRVILKDPGLTSKILRLANSAMYNHSGRPILSVPHAIILLGWDKVRSMVSTVRYIEQFASRSPCLRELLLLSVLTAVHGRDVAAAIGYPRPEEAYICGLFRNLGEVLIACHYPHEYSRIILTMHEEKIPERPACWRVFDFAWDEVATRIAASWNMPAQVRLSVDPAGAPAGTPQDRCLVSVANYGHELTRALYRKGTGLDSIHLQTVIDPEGQPALVSVRDLSRIVDTARIESQQTFSALRVPTDTLHLAKQAERARQILKSAPVFDQTGLSALQQAIQRASRATQNDFELTPLLTALLEDVRAIGFEHVVFGLMNENLTCIRGRLATGESVDDVLERFQFPVDGAEGPMQAALQRKEDVFVDRARDARYNGSALVTALDPGAFALLPIVIDGKVAGCLYADLPRAPASFDLIRPALSRARDVITSAIRKKAPPSSVTNV